MTDDELVRLEELAESFAGDAEDAINENGRSIACSLIAIHLELRLIQRALRGLGRE